MYFSLEAKDLAHPSQMLQFDGNGGWFSFHRKFIMYDPSGLHLMEDSR